MSFGRILLLAVGVLVLCGIGQRVLDRLRLTDRQALLFIGLIFVGGWIPSIPLGGDVSVNIGGALVPLGLCIYLMIRAGTAKERWRAVFATVLSAAAVLLLVCAAVYMNWRYTDDIQKNAGKTLGQTTLVSSQDGEKGTEPTAAPAEDDYFATARLSRKQARDNAISMLKEAERDENAQQSVLNEASQTLQVLAAYTVAESQIESLVTAKGYAECVVFMGAESVSVVVAPPEGGLTATDAARIKDIVISETDYTAQQIKIMEAN